MFKPPPDLSKLYKADAKLGYNGVGTVSNVFVTPL